MNFRILHLSRTLQVLLLMLCFANVSFAKNLTDAVILHCFDWKYTTIQNNLDKIKEAGYTYIQTSPIQACSNTGTAWYWLYQPKNLTIADNQLGTVDELKAMITAAHAKGLKVIVDVVANQLGGSGYDSEYGSYFHNNTNGIDYSNRSSITTGSLLGTSYLTDLKSEDSWVIGKAKSLVASIQQIGADGIRWDAAKHIGLPSEDCNFWSSVIPASSTLESYGEILDEPKSGGGNNNLIKEYNTYMSVTDNAYGNAIRDNIKSGNYSSITSGNLTTKYSDVTAGNLVLWAESHDNYSNKSMATTNTSVSVINKTWALVGGRQNYSALYFARPKTKPTSTDDGLVKVGDTFTDDWEDPEVIAVNKFHANGGTAAETFGYSNGIAYVLRDKGAVLVGSGNGDVSVSNTGSKVTAGTYTDIVSGNTFTVTADNITGTMGAKGVAVFYDGSYHIYKPTLETTTEKSVFIEVPSTVTMVNAWVWNGGDSYDTQNTAWPGDAMTLMGMTADGTKNIFKWTYAGSLTADPANVIFTTDEGNNKLCGGNNLVYVNHGYYKAGIANATATIDGTASLATHHSKSIKVYGRVEDDKPVHFYSWRDFPSAGTITDGTYTYDLSKQGFTGTWEVLGDWNTAFGTGMPTVTKNGNTWCCFEYNTAKSLGAYLNKKYSLNLDLNKVELNLPDEDYLPKIIMTRANPDATNTTQTIVQTQDFDLPANESEIYLQFAAGTLKGDYTYYENGATTTTTSNLTRNILHEITPAEAEGKSIVYYLVAESGGTTKEFQLNTTRNQESGIHSTNTNLYEVGITDASLPGADGSTVNLYIKGVGSDGTTYYNYRPETSSAISTTIGDGKYYTFSQLGENINPVNTYTGNWTLTKGAVKSLSFLLNTSTIMPSWYTTNEGLQKWNTNKSTGQQNKYGVHSVSVMVNNSLPADANGYYITSNSYKENDATGLNAGISADDKWDYTKFTMEPMDKLTTIPSTIGESTDVVYYKKIDKPASEFNTLFMAFIPATDYNSSTPKWGTVTGTDYSTDKWNHLIRPEIQDGKDATALSGCVNYHPDEVNRSQALSAAVDGGTYSAYTIYLNVTKSTYTVVPYESIDLIGPAIGMINRSTGAWQSSNDFENGERAYHYVRMAKNDNLSTGDLNVWEYTGELIHSPSNGKTKDKVGFRFMTNQIFSTNYRENRLFQLDDDYYKTYNNSTYPLTSNYVKLVDATGQADPEQRHYENMDESLKEHNCDYYDIVDQDVTGRPKYGDLLSTDRDGAYNIGFNLPTAVYTIRFWKKEPKDANDNIIKDQCVYWYTIDKAVAPPKPIVPENPPQNCDQIRTFSSAKALKKPDWMHVYVIDKCELKTDGKLYAHFKSLTGIPANTGVIIAYSSKTATDKSGGKTFLSSDEKADQEYIYDNYSLALDPDMDATPYTYTGSNYLVPTVNSVAITPSVFKNGDETKISARNYLFSAYKKKGASAYTLCFLRAKASTMRAQGAYLQVPSGDTTIPETPNTVDYGINRGESLSDFGDVASAKAFNLYDDEDATGITTVPVSNGNMKKDANAFYTLQGVRIDKPSMPGIYIHNGKKIIIR